MTGPSAGAKLDVNVASADEIDAVGPLTGHGFEIVRYRGERGRFAALRQIDEVPGMSGKLSDADRALLTA